MNRKVAILILTVSFLVYGCKSHMSTGETVCKFVPETETEIIKNELQSTKDSLAQLSLEFSNENGKNFEYLIVRLKNIESDSSIFKELMTNKTQFSNLPAGIYQIELRFGAAQKFKSEMFKLDFFDHRMIAIKLGKPAEYITLEKKVRKRSKNTKHK